MAAFQKNLLLGTRYLGNLKKKKKCLSRGCVSVLAAGVCACVRGGGGALGGRREREQLWEHFSWSQCVRLALTLSYLFNYLIHFHMLCVFIQ